MKFLTIVFLTLISPNLWASAPSATAATYTGDHKSSALQLPATAATVRPMLVSTHALFAQARFQAILAALTGNGADAYCLLPRELVSLIVTYLPWTIALGCSARHAGVVSNRLYTVGLDELAVHELATGRQLAKAKTQQRISEAQHMLLVDGRVFLVGFDELWLQVFEVVYTAEGVMAGTLQQASVVIENPQRYYLGNQPGVTLSSVLKIRSSAVSEPRLFLNLQIKNLNTERYSLFTPFMEKGRIRLLYPDVVHNPDALPLVMTVGALHFPINQHELLIVSAFFLVYTVNESGKWYEVERYTSVDLGFNQKFDTLDAVARPDAIHAVGRREDGVYELLRFVRGPMLDDEAASTGTAASAAAASPSNCYSVQRVVLDYQPVKIFRHGERLIVIDTLGVVRYYKQSDLVFEKTIEVGIARKIVWSPDGVLCFIFGEGAETSVTCLDVSE